MGILVNSGGIFIDFSRGFRGGGVGITLEGVPWGFSGLRDI